MTEPRTRRGDGYASTGAVRQHAGKLPIYVCTTCGAEVVWVESTRTGRPYLVTVSKGYLGQRYYVGANVHPRDCGERRARELAEADWPYRWSQLSKGYTDAMLEMRRALDRGEIDDATFLEALDALGEIPGNARLEHDLACGI